MPKVAVSCSLTLPLPGQQYSNVKVGLVFDDLDPEGDLEAQLSACLAAATRTSEVMDPALAQQASDLSGIALEGLGLPKEFAAFKQKVTDLITRIANEVTRQKGVLDGVTGDKQPANAGPKGRKGKADPGAPGAEDGGSPAAG